MNRILSTEDDIRIAEIDKSARNSWRWEWMKSSETVNPQEILKNKTSWTGPLTMNYKDYIRKVDHEGLAICTACPTKALNYAKRGSVTFADHMKTQKHVKAVVAKLLSSRLPGASNPSDEHDGMYGIAPVYSEGDAAPKPVKEKTAVHILDRRANLEAMLLAFLVEHNMPFTAADPIIKLSKQFAKDPTALRKLSMHRTTASYKLQHGLAKTMKDELVAKLRETPFSLNLDEATSSNLLRVFTVLVSYFDSETQSLKVEQLGSLNVPVVDAQHLFDELTGLCSKLGVPLENLLAMLMDSASTMRGDKSGLETRIREIYPQLADIDGDTCHHVHNIVKRFTKHFEHYIEGLFRCIYTDFKTSADSMEMLKDISYHLGLTFRKPVNYIAARWLSILDTSLAFTYMQFAYVLYYQAVASKATKQGLRKVYTEYKKGKNTEETDKEQRRLEKRQKYVEECDALILDGASQESIEAIRSVQTNIKKKFVNGTAQGKVRKMKIVNKLIMNRKYVDMLTGLYETILTIFKKYVMLFQQEKPLIHKIFPEQLKLVKTFFSYFVKPEALSKCGNAAQVKTLDLSAKNILPYKLIFLGSRARLLFKKGKDEDFMDKVVKAYVDCGKYIQQKLPLENKTLERVSYIDPQMVFSSSTEAMSKLLELPESFANVLKGEELNEYATEIRLLCNDRTLPSPLDEDEKEVDCLTWWRFLAKQYPTSFKMIVAILSIFHGPRVESSFSMMSDVIDPKCGRMNIATYDSIQTIKYSLLANKPGSDSAAIDTFRRDDKLYSPINPALARNMRSSYETYNAQNNEMRGIAASRKRKFGIPGDNEKTKKQVTKENEEEVNNATKEHQKILEQAYKPKRKLPVVAMRVSVPDEIEKPKKKKKQWSLDNFFS